MTALSGEAKDGKLKVQKSPEVRKQRKKREFRKEMRKKICQDFRKSRSPAPAEINFLFFFFTSTLRTRNRRCRYFRASFYYISFDGVFLMRFSGCLILRRPFCYHFIPHVPISLHLVRRSTSVFEQSSLIDVREQYNNELATGEYNNKESTSICFQSMSAPKSNF